MTGACEDQNSKLVEVITVADIYIRRWADGKDAALDVTVTSSPASSNLAAAATRLGGALDEAYDRKMHDTADASAESRASSFSPTPLRL